MLLTFAERDHNKNMPQEHIDRRKYIRLNSCFPVEFSLYLTPGNPISQEYQGFTCNVSEGGICLTIRNLKPEDEHAIVNKKVNLKLTINMPILAHPVDATAHIEWVKRNEKPKSDNEYIIGLSYKDIAQVERSRIIRYARKIVWIPRLLLGGVGLLLCAVLVLSFYHIKSLRYNQHLVERLVAVSEVKSHIEKSLNETRVRRDMLESKLSEGTQHEESIQRTIKDVGDKSKTAKARLESELSKALEEKAKLQKTIDELVLAQDSDGMAYKVSESRIEKLNNKIEVLEVELNQVQEKSLLKSETLDAELFKLQKENQALKQDLLLVKEGETSLEKQLADLKLEGGQIEKASIDKMYQWLASHQTRRTGLVVSYEGDSDLKDWGFTYDQALAAQVFLIMGDTKRAESVLRFFKDIAKRSGSLFYNAYDVKTDMPTEYVVHGGPNIWIGISACQYVFKTGDGSFLNLAEDIADSMIDMQLTSSDGSIKGGPDNEWVSTEHNLDAYALFNMLDELTDDQKYKDAASKTLNWLKDVGYNKPEGRFMRGRGDATIATDTFSWAIAALGAKTLKDNNMDPDGIMEFAERECKVDVKFHRPEGRVVDVSGFDFAKSQNVGRGGIISTEWTSQMIVAFKIMADYYANNDDQSKENIYISKARYYLSQLGKMVISSPSPTGQGQGCLPYASTDNVDTGHGWRVAKGRRTGSVAGTAYYIFAYKGYNPLAFE